MKTFKVYYTNGEHYFTNANGTAAEFEAYLKQDGGRVTFETPSGKEFHRYIDRVEDVTRRWYKLEGEYRKQGAIGTPDRIPPQIIKAESPIAAMNTNRQDLYDAGYDHILYKKISTREGNAGAWTEIPMLEALGLE